MPDTPARSERVTLEAEVIDRLAHALEMIGVAFTVDEVTDARALELVARFAAERESFGGLMVTKPNPAIAGVTRNYEVLRGLLGRGDAPRPLRMRRGKDNTVTFDEAPPPRAERAVVEAAERSVREPFDVRRGGALRLKQIQPADTITRVELFDAEGTLVAFGPSFAPLS
jgi:hypothetical protein